MLKYSKIPVCQQRKIPRNHNPFLLFQSKVLVCSQQFKKKQLKPNKKMKPNFVESLAIFQNPNVTLLSLDLLGSMEYKISYRTYLDPYNNVFGEENWLIILIVVFSCLYCIFGMCLALGIILFEKYGLNPGDRQLVDMVRYTHPILKAIVNLIPNN